MTAVTLRQAGLADAEVALTIENLCFTTDKLSLRQIKYLFKHAKAINLVAEVNHQVIAYCICLTPKHPRPARLYSLAVLPQWQGKGIAKQLITDILSILSQQTFQYCCLEVRQSQLKVQQLYQRLGFKITRSLPEYYQDGENGYKMRVALR